MPQNIADLVSDVALTVLSRATPEPVENPLTNILPNRELDGRKTRQAKHTRKTFTARFRAYGAEAPIGRRGDSMVVQEITLPPLSEKLPVDEELIHQLNEHGTATAIDRVIESTYDDVENLTTSVRNRAEKARGEFLSTGKVSINENGFVSEADFGLPEDHIITNGALWSTFGIDIIEAELAWHKIVRKDAKARPTRATVSEAILEQMLKNESYRNEYWQRENGTGPTLNPEQLNQVRVQRGLAPVNVYEGYVPSDAGDVRVIPEDLYILTTDTVGESQWGVTAEALALAGKNSVDFQRKDAPGLVVSQWSVPDPVVTWTKVSSVFLPVAGDINGLLVAKVL